MRGEGTPIRRRLAVFCMFALALAFVQGLGSTAVGAQDEGSTVDGRLRATIDGEQAGIGGVTVVVTDPSGDTFETVSDEDGVWSVELSGVGGEYSIMIEPTTLPDGVTVRDPERNPVAVVIEEGKSKAAIFALETGESTSGNQKPLWERTLQLTVEGVKLGLFLAMAAVGLSLIFGTTGLVNFAHGEMVTWGMLVAYFFNFYGIAGAFGFVGALPAPFGSGVHLVFAGLIAVFLGGLTGYLLDWLVFSRLRARGVGLVSQLVISIGLSLLLRYVFLFAFGGNNRFFRNYSAQSAMSLGPIDITPKDLVNVGLAIAVLFGVGLLLQRTRIGKAMRAVSDNRDLAESSGIDVQRVIRLVWTFGGALAALGGLFLGMGEQVSWQIGFRILLLIFAGVTLGGLGTAYGALVGCLVVGIGIQLSTLVIPAELKNVGALLALILILMVRPQGILGRPERVG